MLTRRHSRRCRTVCLWAAFSLLMGGTPPLVWAQGEAEETTEIDEAESSGQHEEAVDESYRYDPAGKRDPFSSPFTLVADVRPSDNEPKTPLQRFELGQLRLVGVILNREEPKALIEDSKGLGYVVMAGTLVGSNGGVVKSIEPRRILVEEIEIDFYGERRRRERELKLVATQAATDTEERR